MAASTGKSDLDVQRWRSEFPAIVDEEPTHLNHSMNSPIPRRGLEARREFERTWIEEHPHPWVRWREKLAEAKEQFADLINASPHEIAIVPSVTQSLAQVTSALDYGDDGEVVTTEMEFPTVPQFWEAQRRRRDVAVRQAASPDGVRVPEEAYADVIGDDTLLVCSSHAFSATGGLMDPKAVADVAHDRDSYLFLDAYQSLGVVPIDVQTQDIDMLASGTLKFLFGGPGIAFLYVDEDIVTELEPANLGWFSTDAKFEWEDPEYAADASRFQLGTGPIANAYQASAGLSVVLDVGIETIRERTLELTDRLIEGAERRGFTVVTPRADELRSSIVTLTVEDHERAYQRMADAGFKVTEMYGASQMVDSALRISPHFYTTPEEIDAVLDALEQRVTPA